MRISCLILGKSSIQLRCNILCSFVFYECFITVLCSFLLKMEKMVADLGPAFILTRAALSSCLLLGDQYEGV